MSTATISFEAPEDVLHQLDGAASLQHRDRDAILRDALEQYLASDREFTAMVEEGLRQADAGELVEHSEIEARIAGWANKANLQP